MLHQSCQGAGQGDVLPHDLEHHRQGYRQHHPDHAPAQGPERQGDEHTRGLRSTAWAVSRGSTMLFVTTWTSTSSITTARGRQIGSSSRNASKTGSTKATRLPT